jgi:hypothetical protein
LPHNFRRASPIASASITSFLFRFTKGFTYIGAISRTSWPNAPICRAQWCELAQAFHRDNALGSGSEKREHLRPGYLLPERRRSVPSRAMRLKDVLRQIEPDWALSRLARKGVSTAGVDSLTV